MDIAKIQLIQKTISWLNETFVPAVGMKPIEDLPYGDTGDGSSCVIANALNLNIPTSGTWFVGHKTIEWKDEYGSTEEWEIPQDVVTFISSFDDGDYPELITPSINEDKY